MKISIDDPVESDACVLFITRTTEEEYIKYGVLRKFFLLYFKFYF